MRHFLLLLSLLAFAPYARAQELVVSEIKGSVQQQLGKQRKNLQRGQRLSGQDILIIGKEAMLVLLEPNANKRHTLKGNYTGTTREYVQRNEQTCSKMIANAYMNYLLGQAFNGKQKSNAYYEDNYATVFRKGNSMLDSVTVSVQAMDSLYHAIDSLTTSPTDTVQARPANIQP